MAASSGGGDSTLLTAILIVCWYASNIGVLLLNKYLLSLFGFKYPAFLTLCHMLACSVLSYAAAASGLVKLQAVQWTRRQFTKVAVLALIFCLSVVLGNVSLKYLPVSFTQAIGATTPAATALLALVVARQRETAQVYLTLVPIVVGIIIASHAEPMFHLFGFLTAVAATAARALKSVLQGLLLSDPTERMDSLSLLMYMAPIAAAALVPITYIFEPEAGVVALKLGQEKAFWLLLALNSAAAFSANLLNFLVTRHTSPLTLQVLGQAKGVVAAVISVFCFRNPVNTSTVMGYAVTVSGVAMYSRAKNAAKKQQLLRNLEPERSGMANGSV